MSIAGFKDCDIYVAGAGIKRTSLAVSGGRISGIGDCPDGITLPDGLTVLPGFIDEHIHGAVGADVMEGTRSACERIAAALPEEGTTAFLFTTMTMDRPHILAALSAAAEYIESPARGATALGVHLEGPFISARYAGAQSPENILPPDVGAMREFIDGARGNVKMVTLSYSDQALPLVRYLTSLGITVSLGHTDASGAAALEGIKNGISCGTHTFNAMSPFRHRDIGAAGALLLSGARCELICDLKHVSEDAVRLLYKLKGGDIVLITDAMEAKGMPEGEYSLGGSAVTVKDGEARLKDGTLAGSVLRMNDAVKNAVTVLGIPLTEVVDMATCSPARNLGIADRKGSIAVGKDADLTVVDRDLNVVMTVVGGELVYKRG